MVRDSPLRLLDAAAKKFLPNFPWWRPKSSQNNREKYPHFPHKICAPPKAVGSPVPVDNSVGTRLSAAHTPIRTVCPLQTHLLFPITKWPPRSGLTHGSDRRPAWEREREGHPTTACGAGRRRDRCGLSSGRTPGSGALHTFTQPGSATPPRI